MNWRNGIEKDIDEVLQIPYIFVNATNKGREDLDNLMQSLVSTDYREMKDQVIREE